MPVLVESRFAEIASWTEGIRERTIAPGYGPGAEITDESVLDPRAWEAVSGLGYGDQAQASGPESVADIAAVRELVAAGEVTAGEAEAFLAQKYPGAKWSGGRWGDALGRQLEAALADGRASYDDVQAILQDEGGGELGAQPIVVDEAPRLYSAERLTDIVQSIANQTSAAIQSVQRGNVRFDAHTVDGKALVPGSVPPTALNPIELQAFLNRLPGPEDAVGVRIARDARLDPWVDDGTTKGPGRLRRTLGISPSSTWNPSPGIARYRVLRAGDELGVMALWSVMDTTLYVTYGMVIVGIPHYLRRRPTALLALQGVPDGPTSTSFLERSLGSGTAGWNSATRRLFWGRADDAYRVSGAVQGYETVGVDAVLNPDGGTIPGVAAPAEGAIGGLHAVLVTGTTAEEVWRQLHSSSFGAGGAIGGPGPGPHLSAPPGATYFGVAPPSVHDWDGVAPGVGDGYHVRNETQDLSNASFASRLVQGVPFAYEDCERMRCTDTRFSLVIQTSPLRKIYTGFPGGWARPQFWWQHGVRLVEVGRDWAVDVIVS